MPAPINFYINLFWLLLLAGIVGALLRLHWKVKRALHQNQNKLSALEQKQQQQVQRIETIEQEHKTILQELAHVFERLKIHPS